MVDSGCFNRFVALGVANLTISDSIDRIVGFYRDLDQLIFRVELAPVATPLITASLLHRAGQRQVSGGMTEVLRRLGSVERRLGSTTPTSTMSS